MLAEGPRFGHAKVTDELRGMSYLFSHQEKFPRAAGSFRLLWGCLNDSDFTLSVKGGVLHR